MSVAALRDQPHLSEHYASQSRRMERGKMPKSLDGLVRWFVTSLAEELPERLHKHEVWHDQVSEHELGEGVRPQGGSHLGSPAYAAGFRLILEAGASVTDEDGFYRYPIRAALSRLCRRDGRTVAFLMAVALAEGDWQSVAVRKGYHPLWMTGLAVEMALRMLWVETYDRTTRDVA